MAVKYYPNRYRVLGVADSPNALYPRFLMTGPTEISEGSGTMPPHEAISLQVSSFACIEARWL